MSRMSLHLGTPVRYVKGVGERRAATLEKVGIASTLDLLRYKPMRYEDRTHFRSISGIRPDQPCLIRGRVLAIEDRKTRQRRLKILELLVSDESATLPVKFFNQPYLARVFKQGEEVILYGVPRLDGYSLGISLINPEFELLAGGDDDTIHTARIVPIYRRVGPVTSRQFRNILYRLLQQLGSDIEDPLPDWIRRRYTFPALADALQEIHFPVLPEQGDRSALMAALERGATRAHGRLAYDEFFDFQRGLQVLRENQSRLSKERRLTITGKIREVIKSVLPFHPTNAQKRVVKEIADDMCSSRVMSRLLQGDVGSGKTIVAIQAMIIAVENRLQCVLMVPTEVLAEQHYQTLTHTLEKTGYRVALLTGGVTGKERKQILSALGEGLMDIVVGTHAVFQKGVKFKNLGLVVIDEQHRFGVRQRFSLQKKGQQPDTLVMTATPIPRSLALTLYGDLDVSIIDELPPGRQPVQTVVRGERDRTTVYRTIRREIEKGRQSYVVFPLVEESEKVELRAATEMAGKLKAGLFSDVEIALLHGRLSGPEKESILRRFKDGEIRLLVSTTVIEVGIDVPNASLMVIEHANRFGLSQLHQLRGRIGRGKQKSVCVLLSESGISSEARERLRIMEETNDGFRIAEKDLELRGPGDFVGTRQSGLPHFRFANLIRDRVWLERAQADAREWLKRERSERQDGAEMAALLKDWEERFGLFQVG